MNASSLPRRSLSRAPVTRAILHMGVIFSVFFLFYPEPQWDVPCFSLLPPPSPLCGLGTPTCHVAERPLLLWPSLPLTPSFALLPLLPLLWSLHTSPSASPPSLETPTHIVPPSYACASLCSWDPLFPWVAISCWSFSSAPGRCQFFASLPISGCCCCFCRTTLRSCMLVLCPFSSSSFAISFCNWCGKDISATILSTPQRHTDRNRDNHELQHQQCTGWRSDHQVTLDMMAQRWVLVDTHSTLVPVIGLAVDGPTLNST